MPLEAGARLGPYEVLAPLGAGGMGEVYRARDTKLGRDVALKVLPEAFTSDPDRLARFEREAKVLASLNHPHIGQIYGLEEGDGQKALVLELVEGPTLADRIAQGPIALDEALPLARQIAEALEAAHEQGIIHRDLKPVNVKVKPDGTVKVLDFGLAKAFEPEASDPNASQSPTLTARATQMGVILGTAAYMSPEQARGKPVDKRADIWAFGVVLYEMLTGRRPFVGEDVSLTLAEVMKSDPDWSRLPELPPPIHRMLRRCLEKSPQRRLHDVADARLEIEEVLAWGAFPAGPGVDARSGLDSGAGLRSPKPGANSLLLWAIGVAFAGAALGFVVGRGGNRLADPSTRRPSGVVTRTSVNLPESALLALGIEVPLVGFESPAVALSPDGRHLVYVGRADQGTRLYHRDLTLFDDPRPIPGTEGVLHASFSPDSAELVFLTTDRVRKVALGGGTVTTLCRVRTPVLVSWVGDTIYFTDREGMVLNRVAAGGGEPVQLLDTRKRYGRGGPVSSVLPGGRAALISVFTPDSSRVDYAEIRVVSLDGREDKALGTPGGNARYLPSGHLVLTRGGALLAAPFDLERLELRGPAVPVLTGFAADPNFAQVHAAFADDGTVAFVPGRDLGLGRVAWIDRKGQGGWLDVDERAYQSFDVSPDGRRVAVQVADVRDYVWVWDSESGGRDLGGPGLVGWPVWSSDGHDLALTRRTTGSPSFEIVRHALESQTTERLASSEFEIRPESWVSGGRLSISESASNPRVGRLEIASGQAPQWVRSDSGEDAGGSRSSALSPDGAWVAYTTQAATGRNQIWLEELGGATRRQVSTDGGVEAVWCRRCDELFYRQSNRILASRIRLEPRLEIGAPRVVFKAPDFVDTWGISFRVSSDGQRLYYVRRSHPPVRDRIHFVQNFFSELERLVPAAAP